MQGNATAARTKLIKALETLAKALRGGPESNHVGIRNIGENATHKPVDFPCAAAVRRASAYVRSALRDGDRRRLVDKSIADPALLEEVLDFVDGEVGSVARLPAGPAIFRRLDELIRDLGGKPSAPKPDPNKPIFDRNSQTIVFNGKSFSLSSGERYVLALLVEKRAASLPELQTQHQRPDKVLKGLRTKYPPLRKFISLPGGPGKGGYSTTIESR